jgi:eukaryotic-like serine/threonine-protein kinase
VRKVEERRGALFMISAYRARISAWRGEREGIARWSAGDRHASHGWELFRHYGQSLLGAISDEEIDRGFAQIFSSLRNARRISFALQLATEVYAARGRVEDARVYLLRAAAGVLVDVEWLDRCPLLACLRDLPDFAQARRRVHTRAEGIWTP